MKYSKYIMSGLGYTIGSFILAPIVLFSIGEIFLGGNIEAIKYADTYIQESDTIVVDIPLKMKREYSNYGTYFGRNSSGIIGYERNIFYSNKYKKHLVLITFTGINLEKRKYVTKDGFYYIDCEQTRNYLETPTISARVNRHQWNDLTYGTVDNPMPIFWKNTLSEYDETMAYVAIVSDEINKKFVEQYLAHGLSKKEFKRLFEVEKCELFQ